MKSWIKLGMAAVMVVATVVLADDIPDPWKSKDVGDCSVKGSATVKDGKFTLKGSGNDIWDTADGFQYMYQPLAGDATIIAKVNSLENTNEWAKCGVMIREKLEADSKHVMMVTTAANQCHLQYRTDKGGESSNADAVGDNAPSWVKLVREGDKFKAFSSKDGKEWTPAGDCEVKMPKEAFIGICLTSHEGGTATTAVVSDIKVETK